MRSRSAYTTIVVLLPLAKANDPNDRVIVKDQYNQWLQLHPTLKQPGKIKDYGMTWVEAVRTMQGKVNTANTPPRRSLDYANMLINKPNDKKHNILVFTPKMKKFIFNKYKTVHKSGPQEIDITSLD